MSASFLFFFFFVVVVVIFVGEGVFIFEGQCLNGLSTNLLKYREKLNGIEFMRKDIGGVRGKRYIKKSLPQSSFSPSKHICEALCFTLLVIDSCGVKVLSFGLKVQ